MGPIRLPTFDSWNPNAPAGAERFRFRRRFQIFLAATLFIYGLGAFFGRHPYVLTAAVLFTYACREWRQARDVLSGLSISVQLPELWPAGVAARAVIRIASDRRVEQLEVGLILDDETELPGAVFDVIVPDRPGEYHLELPALPRGVLDRVCIRVGTGGVMGLIRQEEIRPLPVTMAIYPAPVAPVRFVAPPMEPAEVTTGLLPGPLSPMGLSVLRPFSTGDSLRRVHWRATARLGEIVVMSTRVGPLPRVLILVDTGQEAAIEQVLAVASHALLMPDGNRRRVLALAVDGPESVHLGEEEPIQAGRKRLARAHSGAAGDLRSFLARTPRHLPQCEILVVSATPPNLPSVEGYPMGFLIAGTGGTR